jgi:hypothetical protein
VRVCVVSLAAQRRCEARNVALRVGVPRVALSVQSGVEVRLIGKCAGDRTPRRSAYRRVLRQIVLDRRLKLRGVNLARWPLLALFALRTLSAARLNRDRDRGRGGDRYLNLKAHRVT